MGSRITSPRLSAGPALALLVFLLFALLAHGSDTNQNNDVTAAAAAAAEAADPDSKPDLICPSQNPDECYPRVFQATDDFQVVRDDQEIPPGLHVKIDVSTGQKQAKINDPTEQNAAALDGLPMDSSIVVVEEEGSAEEDSAPRIPVGAPAYEPVGKIKVPEAESQAFHDSLTVLKTLSLDDRPLDAALAILQDISHDIYYGLKVAEDANAVRQLLCMMSAQDVFAHDVDSEAVKQAGQAAAIIGAALQNNHKALAEVERAWADISRAKCGGGGAAREEELGKAVFGSLTPAAGGGGYGINAEGSQLSLTKAKASALRGLIKSPTIRDAFIANDGMAQILRILENQRPELAPAQQKLANLVLDNFLDESMGATLGVWPRAGEADDDWDHQLKTLAKLHKSQGDHWSAELWTGLQTARQAMRAAGSGGAREKAKAKHDEL